ncbi:MAG: hypothetical protein NT007_16735 [Candidatus Kapabacteria bacterium]|nr:hypothetical protein [Candidatus Kapabacteria bacterium]
MKIYSLLSNGLYKIISVICILVSFEMSGCYSFTGGSLPDHLKTLYIANVVDNSGYGVPQYRENMSRLLFEKFRNDNSLKIVESSADCRLTVTISSIRESVANIRPGEIESRRKISVVYDVEFYDNVKKKLIPLSPSNFRNEEEYDLAQMQTGRDNAVNKISDRTALEILMAVVSGW